jgi:threonine/homoserine/homoserine lactone efflux protein
VHGDAPLPTLLSLVVTVPTACLLIWAAAGRALASVLARPKVRKVFAAVMGSALLAFAIVVLTRDE